VVALYPFVRFRAALGFGFIGFLFWTGDTSPTAMFALIVGSIGLYFCTVFVSYLPVIVCALMGLAGLGAVSWMLIS
jgi:hypothetical protein